MNIIIMPSDTGSMNYGEKYWRFKNDLTVTRKCVGVEETETLATAETTQE